ncbi:MAG: hypothetical protein RLZZ399_1343 [Verrucomicrobiota bacterium]|jgi:hypothetical protein
MGAMRHFMRGGGRERASGGFILLEAMIATAMFAMAVLALARSVDSGLRAGVAIREDARARRALVNWMRELEAGSQAYRNDSKGVDLKGEFLGMVLRQSVVPLKLEDQRHVAVDGILEVTLEVSWMSGRSSSSKTLKFYVYPTGNS